MLPESVEESGPAESGVFGAPTAPPAIRPPASLVLGNAAEADV